LEKSQLLLDTDPENEEIMTNLINPNIMEEMKWKIYSKARFLKHNNQCDAALKIIKLIEPFITQFLKWYTLLLKLLAIKKEWDQVENQKYNYLLIDENQIVKYKELAKQVTDIFNLLHEKKLKDKNNMYNYIQLQADWCHLGIKLQRADMMINDRNFNDALVEAQKVWLKIKENGVENRLKEECRNVISEALQGLEQFDEAEQFNVQNISCHNKSIRAHIIAMRNAVHNKRWDKVKEEENLTDLFIAKLEKPEKGDFVGNMFRNQMIDIMNHTNQLLGRNESFDYDDPEPYISKKNLPPPLNKYLAIQHQKPPMLY
jgi:hypothetical protein